MHATEDWLMNFKFSYGPASIEQEGRSLLAVIPVPAHVIRGLCKVYTPAATDNVPSSASRSALTRDKRESQI